VQTPKNVLVVDDEPSIRALYQMAFAHSGCHVDVAPSAEEALEILRAQKVDILFLDLNLPGMNGLEVAEKIRTQWPDIRIIGITGNLERYGQQACDAAGFHSVLPKPIQLKELLEAVEDE
jgi:CheY-like chemotaxis protein